MLTPLTEAMDGLEEAWGAIGEAGDLTRTELMVAVHAMGQLRRCSDALQAQLAAAVVDESRTELGSEGLAKQQGYRSSTQLLAAVTGSSSGEAARFVRVGEATAPRTTLTGDSRPAKRPHVQQALRSGTIGMSAAAAIIALLDRIAPRVSYTKMDEAEKLLVEQAPGLNADQLGKLIVRVEAWLDPDGVAPREDEQRASRSLSMHQRDGKLHMNAVFDAESGAPLKAAIEAYVSRQFQARQDAVAADAPDADHRTVRQMQADALTYLAEHALGCDEGKAPLGGAQVVVRMTFEDVQNGTGTAIVDGMDQPIDITTARRMAASGGIIPWVCGGEGEVLDLGRERRLFTKAQKLVLAERDGGCAMCGLPPGMSKAHHISWWVRDAGRTDLSNGVLLCTSCHHRIHDNGWDIRIDGTGIAARVWFIPPAMVDPSRVPRLGGRARFDLAA
ncbi:MAG: DUF222 domain-containing protein [Pseudoclavibacter sp.]